MATVSGPLHSDGTHGTFGRHMTFSRSARGHVCRKTTRPTGSPSASQAGIRNMVAFLTGLWSSLTTEEQASWLLPALEDNVSPANAFFTFNMNRWGISLGPQKSFVSVPSEPYAPTLALDSQGGSGFASLLFSPQTLPATIDILQLMDPPSHNCLGTYTYLEDYGAFPAYRKSTVPVCRLYWDAGWYNWMINFADSYELAEYFWYSLDLESSVFTDGSGWSENVLSDLLIPGVDSDPAAAIAIFRSSAEILAPDRRLCRAVLCLDVDGMIHYTDRNQIVSRPAVPAGLPAGTYHFAGVPLSLDGRMGELSADSVVVVT